MSNAEMDSTGDSGMEHQNSDHEERLCAYLFGELDAGERRQVEELLERDPSLRAELERLEGTARLVRETYGEGDALSPAAMEQLLERAQPREVAPPASSWNPAGLLRAAAAVLVLAGGTTLLVQSLGSRTADEQLASAPYTYGILGELADTSASAPEGTGTAPVTSSATSGEAPRSAGVIDGPFSQGAGRFKGVAGSAESPRESESRTALAELNQESLGLVPVGGLAPETGTYRGAGDSVPPRSSVAGRPLAETRSAGKAPAGPGSPGPPGSALYYRAEDRRASRGQAPAEGSAGSDVFYLGRAAEQPEVERLLALGYTAAETGASEPASRGRGQEEPGRERRDSHDSWFHAPAEDGEDQSGSVDLDRAVRGLIAEELQEEEVLDLDTRVELELDRLRERCRALPHERPRDMFFRLWGDNPFALTEKDALSTFGVDVDSASFALARRMIREGHLPEKAQIRTEEFVNWFEPDLQAPTGDTFAVSMELAPSPYGGRGDRWLLRVGVRAMEVDASERDPLALTFVVDVSGSMKQERRLELVKHALRMLTSQLDGRDSIALVAFSTEARVILPATPANQRGVIEAAIHQLQPEGNTNAEAGLKLGYELASAGLVQGSHNRVVFLSDGVANLGQTDQDRINADVERLRDQGIYLNTIGVGLSNHNDVFLEQLADNGDGICDYVADEADVQRAIVDRFVGAFVPVARDVKVQVEFDPGQVVRYRQLGYENRAIADADFRNDGVDAGEVGAGHQVVCLYELERSGDSTTELPLATARLRWLPPGALMLRGVEALEAASPAREMERSIQASEALGTPASASAGWRRDAAVAQLAEVLRRSVHAVGDSFEALLADLRSQAAAAPGDEQLQELVVLTEQAAQLIVAHHQRTRMDELRDELQRLHIQLHAHELGEIQLDGGALDGCRSRVLEVEGSLRAELERELGSGSR